MQSIKMCNLLGFMNDIYKLAIYNKATSNGDIKISFYVRNKLVILTQKKKNPSDLNLTTKQLIIIELIGSYKHGRGQAKVLPNLFSFLKKNLLGFENLYIYLYWSPKNFYFYIVAAQGILFFGSVLAYDKKYFLFMDPSTIGPAFLLVSSNLHKESNKQPCCLAWMLVSKLV